MKRILALVLAMLMILSLFAACGTKEEAKEEAPAAEAAAPAEEAAAPAEEEEEEEAPAEEAAAPAESAETIYIGVSAALTGEAPLEGEMTLKGIQLAVDECNEAGGINGAMVEIVYEDDANTANLAVNVMEKFAGDERIVAVLGPHRTANVLAVEAIAKEAGMQIVTGATSEALYGTENDYISRIRRVDTLSVSSMVAFAVNELGASKIAILHDTDDYGSGAMEIIKRNVEEKYPDVEIVAVEGVATATNDFTGQLLNIQNAGTEVLIPWLHDPPSAIMIRQYKEMGMEESFKIAGSPSFTNNSYYDLMEDGVSDGIYSSVDFTVTNPDPTCAAFTEKFREVYGLDPELWSGCYYDGAKVLLAALQRAADESGEVTRETVHQAMITPADPTVGNQGSLYITEDNKMDYVHQAIVAQSMDKAAEYIYTVTE